MQPKPVLLIYDWITVLDDEVSLIWKRKLTTGSWIYLIVRVLSAVQWLILTGSGYLSGRLGTDNQCAEVQRATAVLAAVVNAAVSGELAPSALFSIATTLT